MMNWLEQDERVRAIALRSIPGFFAYGMGSGLSRFAPGTVGTLAAVPLALLLSLLAPPFYWLALIACFLLGIWCCEITSRRLGAEDPGGIVWDEMVSYWLVLAFVPLQWPWWLAAFVLFRIFDILKPWPICWLERNFKGGFGIMLDDVLAAIYALALLIPAQQFLNI